MKETNKSSRILRPVFAALMVLAALTMLPANRTSVATAAPAAAPAPDISIPDKCAGCHYPPNRYHYGMACHQCHSASRFVPAKVARPAHPMLLVGRHKAVECGECHGLVRTPPTECTACHSAPKVHLAGTCTGCHTPEGWAESARAAGITGPSAPHVVSSADDCLTCHAPAGPNWPAPADHSAYSLGQCRLCHASSAKASVMVDHSGVEGLFQGSHTLLSCLQCHASGQFQGTASACVACHQDDDRHSGQLGQDCARCHSPQGWSGASFDHGGTGFALDGGHSGLACTSCHAGGIFSGTPSECGACHGEPGYHAGALGTGCAECHTTGGWLPASYGRPHTFPVNHKGASNCRTCHPASLGGYTCFGCHNEAEIAQKHEEHGIPNWSNCVECHPDGREH